MKWSNEAIQAAKESLLDNLLRPDDYLNWELFSMALKALDVAAATQFPATPDAYMRAGDTVAITKPGFYHLVVGKDTPDWGHRP